MILELCSGLLDEVLLCCVLTRGVGCAQTELSNPWRGQSRVSWENRAQTEELRGPHSGLFPLPLTSVTEVEKNNRVGGSADLGILSHQELTVLRHSFLIFPISKVSLRVKGKQLFPSLLPLVAPVFPVNDARAYCLGKRCVVSGV